MPMTKAEAFEIIELVNNVYDMKFNDTKFDLWLEQIMNYGDYDRTLHKTKNTLEKVVINLRLRKSLIVNHQKWKVQ